ncbi:MAG: hypothetical protein R3253_03760 [Longimicrobiales bacterium]|nr:hypothetical protein [Longimicrobiales bacterium]
MEELIFFAIIIFFSILESIARSRKSKKGEGDEDGGGILPDPREWEARFPDMESERSRAERSPTRAEGSGSRGTKPRGEDLATYDEDPSYDDLATRERPVRSRTSPPQERPSSETMLPGDLLEQLEGLARGRKEEQREQSRTVDLPDYSPSVPAPIERTEVGTGRSSGGPVGSTAPVGSRAPVGSTAPIGSRPGIGGRRSEHFVHRSHAEYGTDPSSRTPSEQDRLGGPEPMDSDAVGVRRQLFGGRPSLRQAVVLKEVLGPPLALRDGSDDPF